MGTRKMDSVVMPPVFPIPPAYDKDGNLDLNAIRKFIPVIAEYKHHKKDYERFIVTPELNTIFHQILKFKIPVFVKSQLKEKKEKRLL